LTHIEIFEPKKLSQRKKKWQRCQKLISQPSFEPSSELENAAVLETAREITFDGDSGADDFEKKVKFFSLFQKKSERDPKPKQ
jgi:hypothetical protein